MRAQGCTKSVLGFLAQIASGTTRNRWMLRSQNRRCEVGIGIMRVFLGIRSGSKTRSRGTCGYEELAGLFGKAELGGTSAGYYADTCALVDELVIDD